MFPWVLWAFLANCQTHRGLWELWFIASQKSKWQPGIIIGVWSGMVFWNWTQFVGSDTISRWVISELNWIDQCREKKIIQIMSEVLWTDQFCELWTKRAKQNTVYFSYTASEIPYSCFLVDCVAAVVFQVIFPSLFFPHSPLFVNFHCVPNCSFPTGSFGSICLQCRRLGLNL